MIIMLKNLRSQVNEYSILFYKLLMKQIKNLITENNDNRKRQEQIQYFDYEGDSKLADEESFYKSKSHIRKKGLQIIFLNNL